MNKEEIIDAIKSGSIVRLEGQDVALSDDSDTGLCIVISPLMGAPAKDEDFLRMYIPKVEDTLPISI